MNISFKMVEVYSTNLSDTQQARALERDILSRYPYLRISFDLEDCDNILRIEYDHELNRPEIEAISNKMGVHIQILED